MSAPAAIARPLRPRHVRWPAAVAAALLVLALGGCQETSAPVTRADPVEVPVDAVGNYCGMLLSDHAGPKGQIHLGRRAEPIWFSSVRDTIAYTRLPEERRDIVAIYVNDMGRVRNWEQPEPGTWTDARTAWYVIDSTLRGGMGAPEAIPFSEEDAARAFRDRNGGTIVRLDDIPDEYVLGPVELAPTASGPGATRHD